MRTAAAGNTIEIKHELTKVSADAVEVTMVMKAGPQEIRTPTTHKKKLDASGSDSTKDKFDTKEGEENVSVGGKSVKCYKMDAKAKDGSMQSTSWFSKEVPGYTVKSLSKVGGTESKMEVVEYEAKK